MSSVAEDEVVYGLVSHEDPTLRPTVVALNARLALCVQRVHLARALALVAPHSGSRAWLQTRPGKEGQMDSVVLRAQDGSTSVQVVVGGEVEVRAHGSCSLSARELAKVTALWPQDSGVLEVVGQTMSARSGRAVWSIPLKEESSFDSSWPSLAGAKKVALGGAELAEHLTSVSSAVAQGQARPALAQVVLTGGMLVATDGQRLHSVRFPGLPTELTTSIPAGAVPSMVRMAAQAPDKVVLAVLEHLVALVVPDTAQALIAQRSVVSPPPGILQLVTGPVAASVHRAVCVTEELRQAVIRVRVMADPDRPALSLNVETLSSRTYLRVQARRADNSAVAYERVPVQWHGPAAAKGISVHHKHLMDLLSRVSGHHVTLAVGDETAGQKPPVVIQEGDFTGWVQQMREPS